MTDAEMMNESALLPDQLNALHTKLGAFAPAEARRIMDMADTAHALDRIVWAIRDSRTGSTRAMDEDALLARYGR